MASSFDVGGLHFTIPAFTLTKNGKTFGYVAAASPNLPALAMAISPNARGSSRAAFTVAITGDLSGRVSLDGPLALKFVDDVATASATPGLVKGRFALGKVGTGLADPRLFIGHGQATIRGAGQDALALTLGVAALANSPGPGNDFTLVFGTGFSQTIAGTSFRKKGQQDVFTGNAGGITQIVIDRAKQTVAITGKGMTLGTFAAGANTVLVSIAIGTDAHAVRVQLGLSGTTLKY